MTDNLQRELTSKLAALGDLSIFLTVLPRWQKLVEELGPTETVIDKTNILLASIDSLIQAVAKANANSPNESTTAGEVIPQLFQASATTSVEAMHWLSEALSACCALAAVETPDRAAAQEFEDSLRNDEQEKLADAIQKIAELIRIAEETQVSLCPSAPERQALSQQQELNRRNRSDYLSALTEGIQQQLERTFESSVVAIALQNLFGDSRETPGR